MTKCFLRGSTYETRQEIADLKYQYNTLLEELQTILILHADFVVPINGCQLLTVLQESLG